MSKKRVRIVYEVQNDVLSIYTIAIGKEMIWKFIKKLMREIVKFLIFSQTYNKFKWNFDENSENIFRKDESMYELKLNIKIASKL